MEECLITVTSDKNQVAGVCYRYKQGGSSLVGSTLLIIFSNHIKFYPGNRDQTLLKHLCVGSKWVILPVRIIKLVEWNCQINPSNLIWWETIFVKTFKQLKAHWPDHYITIHCRRPEMGQTYTWFWTWNIEIIGVCRIIYKGRNEWIEILIRNKVRNSLNNIFILTTQTYFSSEHESSKCSLMVESR